MSTFLTYLTVKVKLWILDNEFEDLDLYQNVPVPVLGPERLGANHPPYITNNSVAHPDSTFHFDADPHPTFHFDASRNDADPCGSRSASLTKKLNLDMLA
jgi:hypothetical protein